MGLYSETGGLLLKRSPKPELPYRSNDGTIENVPEKDPSPATWIPMPKLPLHLLLALALFLSLGAAKVPETRTAAAPDGFQLPTNTEQRYIWLKGRQKVGETVLRFQRVPRDDGWAYVIDSVRRYDYEGISQRSQGMTVVSDQGLPLRFEESTSLNTVQGARTSQKTSIEFDGQNAHVTSQHNGPKGRRVERDVAVPEQPTYLYANQALEHWVVFTATLAPLTKTQTVRLLYPDFDRVLKVTFTAGKKESLAIGKEKTEAQRFSFESTDGELTGLLWLDAKGRLLQLKFPAASLRLVLAPDA